jgi:hypothetical protein
MNQPYKRITCPYPGCTNGIRAVNKYCRTHSDHKTWAVFPKKENFKEIRQCAQCGQDFVIRNSKSVYCESCRMPSCEVCGNRFLRSDKGENRVCSTKCSYASGKRKKRSRTMLTCAYCQKTFSSQTGHLSAKYCGRKCKTLASRKPDTDKKRNSYKYRQWRDAVYIRDNYTCQQCGNTGAIQAHHIKEWKDHLELRYDPSNGITLCNTCHENIHGARIPRVSKRFEPHCENCGIVTKGRARHCKSCSMKLSPKAKTQRLSRPRNENGQYV